MVDGISNVLGSRHAIVAGAIGGGIALAEGLLGPIFGPLADLGAAAVTAWIGARSVAGLAQRKGVCEKEALRRASEVTRSSHGAHLAHKTLHFARSAVAKDPEAVKAAGAVAAHCVRSQASSLVTHVLVGWSPPLFGGTRLIAASRAAYGAATFVHALECAAVMPPFAAAA